MREWLLEHLDAEELPGLTWVDRQSGVFKIRWRHGSRHGWTKKDINVFEQWAKHTGKSSFSWFLVLNIYQLKLLFLPFFRSMISL